MAVQSAGILLFRFRDGTLEVFLAHPGGPFWARRDDGAWTIPKGLLNPGEEPLQAATREFNEETGFVAQGRFVPLGQVKQANKKVVHAWALEMDVDPAALRSNSFSLEWPKGSGVLREFPEIDRGGWFNTEQARIKMVKGQAPLLDRLLEHLAGVNQPPAP